MDASDIKKSIKSGNCSDNLICGKSLKWATNNLETFMFYYERICKGTCAQSWHYISRYAGKHRYMDVVNFLKKEGKYVSDTEKVEPKTPNVDNSEIEYIHFKSKGLVLLKELFARKTLIVENILYLALNCGLNGTLVTIKFICERIPSLIPDILIYALHGAIASYFPEVISFCQTQLKQPINKIIQNTDPNSNLKSVLYACPNVAFLESILKIENF